jgi:hypothetical protein
MQQKVLCIDVENFRISFESRKPVNEFLHRPSEIGKEFSIDVYGRSTLCIVHFLDRPSHQGVCLAVHWLALFAVEDGTTDR